MTTVFKNWYYPSTGNIPAYNSADGNLSIEILGANGRRLRLANVDCDTTYGPYDNMTMGRSTTYNGSVSIQDYIANGETDGGPITINADPFYLRIGGAPSPATGKFYGELQIETGVDTGEYVDMEVSGVDFSSSWIGAFSEYQLVADEPPLPASCFWENLIRVSQDCVTPAPTGMVDAYVLMDSGTWPWTGLTWAVGETVTWPEFPLSYDAPVDVPMLPSGVPVTDVLVPSSASAGGGSPWTNANASFSKVGNDGFTFADTSCYAYTTGSGPRRKALQFSMVNPDWSAELPSDFIRDNSGFANAGDLDGRVGSSSWSITDIDLHALAFTTNITANVGAGFGSTNYLTNAAIAGDGQYPNNSVSNFGLFFNPNAEGKLNTTLTGLFTCLSGGNVSSNPALLGVSVDGWTLKVYPLVKIVGRITDVVSFTQAQLEEYGMASGNYFAYPPLDVGVPVTEDFPIYDGSAMGWGDIWVMGALTNMTGETIAYVGRIVDDSDPGADHGMIRIDTIGGA